MVAQILMEFRTRGGTGMYSNPDYKKGYEDAMDGKPLPDNPSSPYKADVAAKATEFTVLVECWK